MSIDVCMNEGSGEMGLKSGLELKVKVKVDVVGIGWCMRDFYVWEGKGREEEERKGEVRSSEGGEEERGTGVGRGER